MLLMLMNWCLNCFCHFLFGVEKASRSQRGPDKIEAESIDRVFCVESSCSCLEFTLWIIPLQFVGNLRQNQECSNISRGKTFGLRRMKITTPPEKKLCISRERVVNQFAHNFGTVFQHLSLWITQSSSPLAFDSCL